MSIESAVLQFPLTQPRVLISRLAGTTEAVLTAPVACALRAHFPDAYIAWVIDQKAAPMIRGHQDLDKLIELEDRWWVPGKRLRATRDELRSHRFDIAIDCQDNTAGALLGKLSGAKTRIGFRRKRGSKINRLLNNTLIDPVFTHITDRSLELLIPLEIHSTKVQWNLAIPDAARNWAVGWRQEIPTSRVAVMKPGANWESKRWEADRFASTARYLSDRYDYATVAIWGSADERQLAESIARESDGSVLIAPDTDSHQLSALIESADLFISGDTGPIHIAVALGVATIGLYGATRPGECGPYGQIAIQEACEGGSLRHRRAADNSAMRQIGVEHVCAAIDDLESRRIRIAA